MTPNAQRIAIAKACGYRPRATQNYVGEEYWHRPFDGAQVRLPNYLTDLNAMHEAEKGLTDAQVQRYIEHLSTATGAYFQSATEKGVVLTNYWSVYHAPAAQRAEAFLRTLNLWDDTK